MTKTEFVKSLSKSLEAEFGTALPSVEEAAKRFLNLNADVARQKAGNYNLPWCSFYVDTQKSERVVHVHDIAEQIWVKRQAEKRVYEKMHCINSDP